MTALLGDGRRAEFGLLVDWMRVEHNPGCRINGKLVVVDGDWGWVQFADAPHPYKYPLSELRLAAPPKFRDFAKERNGAWPAQTGSPNHRTVEDLADALADYVDLLVARQPL